jgi:hypothetical protein
MKQKAIDTNQLFLAVMAAAYVDQHRQFERERDEGLAGPWRPIVEPARFLADAMAVAQDAVDAYERARKFSKKNAPTWRDASGAADEALAQLEKPSRPRVSKRRAAQR